MNTNTITITVSIANTQSISISVPICFPSALVQEKSTEVKSNEMKSSEMKSKSQQKGVYPRSNHIENARKEFPNAYQKWSTIDEEYLRNSLRVKMSVEHIAATLRRSVWAVQCRMEKLNLSQ